MTARCLLLLLLCAGCGPEGPPRGAVKGRVTFGGDPITGAMVVFEDAGLAPSANLDADGRFELRTSEGPGLPVGTYKVAVMPGRMMESGEESPLAGKKQPPRPKPSTKVAEKYHKSATSGLTAEVRDGENKPFEFDLAK